MTNLAHGYFQVQERILELHDPPPVCNVFLFVEGGEPRSAFAFERFSNTADVKYLRIKFEPPIAPPRYSARATAAVQTLEDQDRILNLDCGPSIDVLTNVQKILETLEQAIPANAAPHLCVDITTMPKAYFLAVLGWALKSRNLPSIRFVYSPGKYKVGAEDKHYFPGTFTEGTWSLKQVHYLEGPTSTRDDRALFAFVGADIGKAEEIFRRYEPLEKALIYPGSVESDDRDKIGSDLSKFFGIRKEDMYFCSRDSAVEALKHLRKSYKNVHNNYGSGGLLFPFGTKLTALAAGIFAAFDPSISMFVRVPERYIPMEVHPDGRLVVVDILDMTHREASSYLRM